MLDRDERQPIRVLHLVSTFALKTDTKWLVQLADHLERDRIELSAACFYGGGPIQDALNERGIPSVNLNVRSPLDPRAAIRAARFIASGGGRPDARARPFDVVHTHLLRADFFGGAAARLARVPVVISTVYALGAYRRQRRRLADPLLDALCRQWPTALVAVCDAVRDDCRRRGWPPERVHTIHTGVAAPKAIDERRVAEFRVQWSPDGRPVVLTIARLSYEKGVEVLIEAAALLRRTHPTVRVVVIGEGPQRAALEQRIARLGPGDVVRLAGFTPHVWEALSAADVFCLPSHSEGLPNALLEAMAVGRPVVATRVGGVPEVVAQGIDGLLTPPGDAAAMAAAIGLLLTDRPLARRLGEAARHTIERCFSAREAARQYAALYEQLRPVQRR